MTYFVKLASEAIGHDAKKALANAAELIWYGVA